jgi:cardiolipin synthase
MAMFELIKPDLLYIITAFLISITTLHLLMQRKKPTSTISWVAVIIMVPYLGILLYMIFHGRKIERISKRLKDIKIKNTNFANTLQNSEIEKLIVKNSQVYATHSNRFELFEDGVKSYHKLIDMLKNAQKSIYISTYILGDDKVTKEILNILVLKAKKGVKVKLLIDAIGSQKLEISHKNLQELKDAGGEYHFFMSLIKKPFLSRLNLRNHRKMIVVDSRSVMSGGINISELYLASDDSDGSLWRDISFVIEGSAALQYEEVFRSNWEAETDDKIESNDIKDDELSVGSSLIHVVASGPDLKRDVLYEALLLAIYRANSRIWILSPYFAPESSLMDALIIARHRGVEVKIISPKSSDHFFVDIARSAFLRVLHKEGAEILFYKNRMLHAKAFVIDDECVVLGSANFDSRSFFYNFEIVSFLYTKRDIKAVILWIENLFLDCEVGMKEASKIKLVIENFFKMFSGAA